MALKDWKKKVYRNKFIVWMNKVFPKMVRNRITWSKPKPHSWKRVEYYYFPSFKSHRIGINGQDFGVFKTKTQALSYAKQYMRTH